MKALVCFGTRPEAIKMAPLVEALTAADRVEVKVLVTGQHRTMLDQVMELFGMTADYDLALMAPNQDLADLTARALVGVRDVIKKEKPDWVFVQGDTTTAFASALAAFYEKTKVAHVEAGLRTGDIHSPWPEEMNRRLVAPITTLHFPPTERAAENLRNEGVAEADLLVTGNTVIDSLLKISVRIDADPAMEGELAKRFDFLDASKRMILVTGHRRESFGDGFRNICAGLATLAERDDIEIVYPVHLNPNVQGPVNELLSGRDNVKLLEPLEYLPFIYLMKRSHIIVTDSGGVQEEAPSLGKPVLVMRDTTERPEGVAAGTVKIVGADTGQIVAETERLLDDNAAYAAMAEAHNPYGDGNAALRIVKRILT